jgi:hypothetical protein
MQSHRQFSPVTSLTANKQASMEKIVGTIKSYGQDAANALKSYSGQAANNVMSYKPFDSASARSAAPQTALYGALAGALLEGGRVGLMNMLKGRDRYEEEDRRPSALMAALRGALVGGAVGGVAPLAAAATAPHLADLYKYTTERNALSKIRENSIGKTLPDTAQKNMAAAAGRGGHIAATYALPRTTVRDIFDINSPTPWGIRKRDASSGTSAF